MTLQLSLSINFVGNTTCWKSLLPSCIWLKIISAAFLPICSLGWLIVVNGILNLDKSTEAGSHWIAVAKIDEQSGPYDEDTVICYDSFGRDNREIIPDLGRSGNGTVVDTDRDAEQEITETDCGARSIAWLVVLDKYGVDVAKLI